MINPHNCLETFKLSLSLKHLHSRVGTLVSQKKLRLDDFNLKQLKKIYHLNSSIQEVESFFS